MPHGLLEAGYGSLSPACPMLGLGRVDTPLNSFDGGAGCDLAPIMDRKIIILGNGFLAGKEVGGSVAEDHLGPSECVGVVVQRLEEGVRGVVWAKEGVDITGIQTMNYQNPCLHGGSLTGRVGDVERASVVNDNKCVWLTRHMEHFRR